MIYNAGKSEHKSQLRITIRGMHRCAQITLDQHNITQAEQLDSK